ncbi:outer membrane lipoprotein-sorting protein [Desulfomicrobium salsuginis]
MDILPKNPVRLLPVLLGALCVAANAAISFAAPSGQELARMVHDRYVGEDMTSRQTMELVPASGEKRVRELTVTAADRQGVRKSIIRFTSPADIEGTGFLGLETNQDETQQFLYLPALKRTRRIVAGQKGRSFVNTDFTYEDMERRAVEDSEHAVTGEETLGGVACWILESRPKAGTDSQYSMVRAWVAKDMLVSLRVDFFIDGKEPVKRFNVKQMERIQDIWTETSVVMEDLHSGHRTLLETKEITYNSGIPDSAFTQQALESW